MRIVATLTTIPNRIGSIKPTLQSIVNQSVKFDAIYLNIPYISKRQDANYIIPSDIGDYAHVIRCEDYGPITKLFGALVSEENPDTIIITFDDDVIYPESLVEKLLTKHKNNPNVAIGSAGIKIGKFPFYISTTNNEHSKNSHWYDFNTTGEEVDIIIGTPGVLYQRGFFPPIDNIADILKYKDTTLPKEDSIVISGYLAEQHIARWVYKMPRVEAKESSKGIQYYIDMTKALWRHCQMFDKRVGCVKKQTITFPFVITFVIVMIISCLIIFGQKNSL